MKTIFRIIAFAGLVLAIMVCYDTMQAVAKLSTNLLSWIVTATLSIGAVGYLVFRETLNSPKWLTIKAVMAVVVGAMAVLIIFPLFFWVKLLLSPDSTAISLVVSTMDIMYLAATGGILTFTSYLVSAYIPTALKRNVSYFWWGISVSIALTVAAFFIDSWTGFLSTRGFSQAEGIGWLIVSTGILASGILFNKLLPNTEPGDLVIYYAIALATISLLASFALAVSVDASQLQVYGFFQWIFFWGLAGYSFYIPRIQKLG